MSASQNVRQSNLQLSSSVQQHHDEEEQVKILPELARVKICVGLNGNSVVCAGIAVEGQGTCGRGPLGLAGEPTMCTAGIAPAHTFQSDDFQKIPVQN